MILSKNIFFIIAHLLMLVSLPLAACTWCAPDAALLSHEVGVMRMPTGRARDPQVAQVAQVLPETPLAEEYLEVYYPKAQHMVDHYFSKMCPRAINQSIATYVKLLSQDPWAYFKNRPDDFRQGEYWEIIVDQCKIIDSFLKTTRVDPQTGQMQKLVLNDVRSLSSLERMQQVFNKTVYMGDYWKAHNMATPYYEFYALYFDKTLLLFNEGVHFLLNKSVKHYKKDLESIFRHLRGWAREREYSQVMSRIEGLAAIVAKRVRPTSRKGEQ